MKHPKDATGKARDLRRRATPAEQILWRLLRNRRLGGFKFRRQQPIGPYIADFFSAAARVIVELDGESHVGKESDDRRRQHWLEKQKIKVLRFWNFDVYDDRDTVEGVIWQTCVTRCAQATSGC